MAKTKTAPVPAEPVTVPAETVSIDAEKYSELKKIIIAQEKEEKFVICEVCGHANPQKTAICKMCSNYLEGVK